MSNDNSIKEKSKEEILDEHREWIENYGKALTPKNAAKAMEEYADIRAVAFVEWIVSEGWRKFLSHNGDTTWQKSGSGDKHPVWTKNLYAIFIKETENKLP